MVIFFIALVVKRLLIDIASFEAPFKPFPSTPITKAKLFALIYRDK